MPEHRRYQLRSALFYDIAKTASLEGTWTLKNLPFQEPIQGNHNKELKGRFFEVQVGRVVLGFRMDCSCGYTAQIRTRGSDLGLRLSIWGLGLGVLDFGSCRAFGFGVGLVGLSLGVEVKVGACLHSVRSLLCISVRVDKKHDVCTPLFFWVLFPVSHKVGLSCEASH